jgi:AcrR family transcriptional regulator
MPRPRFEKLDPEKKRSIIEAASEAFARDGLGGASLNQILAEAGISKGSFYYYFDDKLDLYLTVLDGAFSHFEALFETHAAPELLEAATFWVAIEKTYLDVMHFAQSNPAFLGVIKTFFELSPEEIARPEVEMMMGRGRELLGRYLERGQVLRVIRRDLPMTLLSELALRVDTVMGRWLFEQWDGHDASLVSLVATSIEMFRRVLEAEVQFSQQ